MSKELTGQADRIQTNELSAMNCDDSCGEGHSRDCWHAESDSWMCGGCAVDHFITELEQAVLDATGLDCNNDFIIAAHCDSADELTHFHITNDVLNWSLEVPLYQLNKIKASLTGAGK